MGGLHDLFPRISAHNPGWKVSGSKFRFSMPRRHVDNQPFDGAVGDSFEFFGKNLVMTATNELWPHVFNKI